MLQSIVNPEVFLSPLTTQEAVLSSRMEGTQASMEEVLEYEADPREIQSQLLDVIWAVEQTVNLRPALNDFGERLLAAPHFSKQELGLE